MAGKILEKYELPFLGVTTFCKNIGNIPETLVPKGEEYFAYSRKLGEILTYGRNLEEVKESLKKSFGKSLEIITQDQNLRSKTEEVGK